MLSRLHGSVEHFYVPRLLYQDAKVPVGSDSRMYNLFKLDWDSVDKFKQDSYVKWVEKHWKEQFPAAMRDKMPGTLPPRYDEIVKGLAFALPHDYQVEIQHFTKLYYDERHRVRKFDTCIHDMCLRPAAAAINTAFKLLVDCCYDTNSKNWLREDKAGRSGDGIDNKLLLGCLMRYKFWRESTGHGLIWEHSGLDEVERSANLLMEKGGIGGDYIKLADKYRRCISNIKQWECDEAKFRDFISVGVGKVQVDFPLNETSPVQPNG